MTDNSASTQSIHKVIQDAAANLCSFYQLSHADLNLYRYYPNSGDQTFKGIPNSLKQSNIRWLNKKLLFPYHKILKTAGKRWTTAKTDEDEFGIYIVDFADNLKLKSYKLPLVFPIQNTWGVGSKRDLELKSVISDYLIFSLNNPDMSPADNYYLYAFNSVDCLWSRLRLDEQNLMVLWDSLDADRVTLESSDHMICSGDCIQIQCDDYEILKIESYFTPHIDDFVGNSSHALTGLLGIEPVTNLEEKAMPLRVFQISQKLWICDRKRFKHEPKPQAPQPRYKIYNMMNALLAYNPRVNQKQISGIYAQVAVELEYNNEIYLAIFHNRGEPSVIILKTI